MQNQQSCPLPLPDPSAPSSLRIGGRKQIAISHALQVARTSSPFWSMMVPSRSTYRHTSPSRHELATELNVVHASCESACDFVRAETRRCASPPQSFVPTRDGA
eukprot:4161586-Pleurochrysis_carterae.AAC.1